MTRDFTVMWERISEFLKTRDEEVVSNNDANDMDRLESAVYLMEIMKISGPDGSWELSWNNLLSEYIVEGKDKIADEAAWLSDLEEHEDYMGGRK